MQWYVEQFIEEDPLRAEMYLENDNSRAQVDFLVDKTEISPGARILDLCCGQGRHLIDLARRGYDVVGVDLSEFMLGKCREFAALEGIYLRLITCDMREIDFDSEFDLVINLFTSFGYLETDEEDQKVLNAVARALKPGGRFLIDVQNRDALMKQFIPRHWEETADGRILLAYRCFDPISGRINCREICIYPDGRRKETGHSIRLYTYNELDRMLKSAGLTTISAWGDFEGSRFTPETERMILLSEKLAG